MRKTLLSPMLVYLILFNTGAVLAVEARNKNDLNMEALSLLQQGKITESISVWERIPQGDRTAEVLNNLGVAYYKRSRQYFNGKYGKESYFNEDFHKAKNFLDSSQKIAPKRWSIYLNLGDLYFHYGLLDEAKKNYKLLLSLKPKYKYAEKVNAKISLIERELMLSRNNIFKSFIVEVHPSLPLYVFRIHRNPERVDVLKGEKSSIVQSLSVNGDIDSSDTLLVADIIPSCVPFVIIFVFVQRFCA